MKPFRFFKRHLRWLNGPTLSLLACLQRSPVAPVANLAEEFVLTPPVGVVLKSAVAAAAALGAMNTLVGATPLVPTAGTATGISVSVGAAVSVFYTVNNTQTPPASWKIGGTVPAGLDFSGLTAAGSVNVQNLQLEGTPTTAGVFPVSITVYEFADNLGISAGPYNYTITVAGASSVAPAITTQPQNRTVTVGGSVTFSVGATGNPAPTYQWRKGPTNLAGQTGTALMLSNVQPTDAGNYSVVATNGSGSATSNDAVLTVNPAPTNAPDTPASFGAFASGAREVTLTWLAPSTVHAATGYLLERANDAGFGTGYTTFALSTTATSFVDPTAVPATTYFYRVSATNAGGASTPTAAVPVPTPATNGTGTASFANIATRAFCGSGNNVTIGGFVVSGSAPKRVLVRAVGPSLTAQGIGASEVLLDPTIEVHDAIHGNVVVATNDNWGDNANAAEITTVGAQIGASALLPTDTTSSALLLTLAPGVYSFVVRGKGTGSGIVLLEVYDADATPSGANFANIATRAYCTTNNGVTIGGFVISGTAYKHVLMRAVGPTLTTQGLGPTEVLADPVIELHDAIHGNVLIATNDNAGDNANAAAIRTTGARIGATPLSATDLTSSALLLTLPPGVYSFIAHGKSAAPSGIVLIEVYDAD